MRRTKLSDDPPRKLRGLAAMGGALLTAVLGLTGCTVQTPDQAAATSGTTAQTTTIRLEPVQTAGDNPFSPTVGTDVNNLHPPANVGGQFSGNTVGLFGGTLNQASCDPAKMTAFLQQDRVKAAAWASVLNIQVQDIPKYISTLTPAILRSDTLVTNHGFKDGQITSFEAVLQAGTAVLVNEQGLPVVKCFCGNPLTPPAAFTSVTFVGPQWTNFQQNNLTVVVAATQTVQTFVFVSVETGQAFRRPVTTTGNADTPAPDVPTLPSPAPLPSSSGPTSAQPAPASPAPATSHPTTPAPTTTAAPTTRTSTSAPPSAAPTTTRTAAPTTSAPTTTTTTAPTTPTPTPTTAAPTATTATPTPTGSPAPAAPPASPTATPGATPSTLVTPSITATPSPTIGTVTASWNVGDCWVQGGQAHAVVQVQTDGAHTFTVAVQLGPESAPIAGGTVQVNTQPNQLAQVTFTAQVAQPTPDGHVQCRVTSIVDEHNRAPMQGQPLPPPPDTMPNSTVTTPVPTAPPPPPPPGAPAPGGT